MVGLYMANFFRESKTIDLNNLHSRSKVLHVITEQPTLLCLGHMATQRNRKYNNSTRFYIKICTCKNSSNTKVTCHMDSPMFTYILKWKYIFLSFILMSRPVFILPKTFICLKHG